jgi:hypothetical protein
VPRLPVPTKLLEVDFKPDSHNTLLVRFDHNRSLSLRLHNASSRVKRSLKLDARCRNASRDAEVNKLLG